MTCLSTDTILFRLVIRDFKNSVGDEFIQDAKISISSKARASSSLPVAALKGGEGEGGLAQVAQRLSVCGNVGPSYFPTALAAVAAADRSWFDTGPTYTHLV
jgi:hypothetical protein